MGKLLTFMYEEDRLNALAMYSKMFDDAEDEQILLNRLVSPTRQAVIVARSYNAKERKLQVHAQSREVGDNSDSSSPDYIRVIDQVAEDVLADQRRNTEVDIDQLSLFEANSAADTNEEAVPAAMEAVPSAPAAPAQEPDQVDAFLSDFTIPAEVLAMQDPLAPAETDADADADEQEPSEEEAVPAVPEETVQNSYIAEAEDEADYGEEEEQEPKRKAKVFALILYILFAIPITLIGLVLLVIPTVLSLALAVAAIAGGLFLVTSAFGGFAIFADIMMVLGGALVLLALGLLFLWMFIWFIGGVMVGLVRGVVELAKEWCFKEVVAE